ncbi:MAG: L,D-transpeptidase [Anaerolineales bacterium]
MPSELTRRDFLKLGSLALSSLALAPSVRGLGSKPSDAVGVVRVTTANGIDLYDIPQYPRYSPDVKILGHLDRDQLVYVYEKFESDFGPDFNPQWYRLDKGFAHTAYLQPVKTELNQVVSLVREEGELFEVTVPLTQSYQLTRNGWVKLYRLYYASTHWVTGVERGPDGALWYRIEDELLHINYYVLAEHMRKITAAELAPVSPNVPEGKKKVEVGLSEQRLWAYENGEVVLDTFISTGIPEIQSTNGIPTATPRGNWVVFSKMPVRHMGNGQVTGDVGAYELPGVPWVSYFHEWGVAFHGTYWHDNYGNEMSHGCVNMRPEEAKWLFRWLTPESSHRDVQTIGNGTRVYVF